MCEDNETIVTDCLNDQYITWNGQCQTKLAAEPASSNYLGRAILLMLPISKLAAIVLERQYHQSGNSIKQLFSIEQKILIESFRK